MKYVSLAIAGLITGAMALPFASPATAADTTLEAESMAVNPANAGNTFTDSTASGRTALALLGNSSASSNISLPTSSQSLAVRARGQSCQGWPNMMISVDGKSISNTAVSTTSWADYTTTATIPAGSHTLNIAFTNDKYLGESCDRNLLLDKVTVVAGSPTTTTTPSTTTTTTTSTTPTTPTTTTTTPPSPGPRAFFQTADWLWSPIPSSPALAADNAKWVSYLSASGQGRVANLYEFGVGLVPSSAVNSSTPRFDVTFTKPWGPDPFGSNTVPIPSGTKVAPGSDGQLAVLDPATGMAFGIWQAKYSSVTNKWTGSWGGMSPINGNGIDQTGGTTATGLARYAGVVTTAEFSAAVAANTGLNHALFFSTSIAGPGYVAPARSSDGGNIANVATPMPEGYRVQLDPSINVDAIPGITPGEKVIAKTLQTYGAYAGDQGGARMAFAFQLAPDATSSSNPGAVWKSAGFAWDYYDMSKIPWSSLRVLKNWNGTA